MVNTHHYVVALSSKTDVQDDVRAAHSAGRLIELADVALTASHLEEGIELTTSVAPGGVMVAFRDASVNSAKRFVEALITVVLGFGDVSLAVAVTAGVLEPVRVRWLSNNFEGLPAVASARLLARLEAGQLAFFIPGQPLGSLRSVWGTLGRVVPTTIAGKHPGEDFDAFIISEVFPRTTDFSEMDVAPTNTDEKDALVNEVDRKLTPLVKYLRRFATSTDRLSVEHYIDLRLQWPRQLHAPTLGRAEGERGSEDPMMLAEIARRGHERPIVLVGEPGAGKTTVLVQYLRDTSAAGERLPVFVSMALYRPGRDLMSLMDLREFSDAERNGLLVEGKLCVVWDGVNEARCEVVDDVFQEIIEFCQKFPRNEYLLSCRTAEFPPWVRGHVNELYLLPVTEKQVRDQFHAILGRRKGIAILHLLGSRELEWLHLRELCANPRLLTMVLALVRYDGPPAILGINSKARLYGAFLERLYHRELGKPKESDWLRVLPIGIRDDILATVASRMQAAETVAVDESVLQEWISEELGREKFQKWWPSTRRPGVKDLCTAITGRPPFRTVDDVSTNTRQYAFLHQSFGEYYAGLYLAGAVESSQYTWKKLDPLIADQNRRQWEVVEFVAGLLNKPEELIARITTLAARDKEQAYLVLAARCVRAGARVSDKVADDIRIRLLDAFKNWGRPFDYELIHAMAEALSEVGPSFPERLCADFKWFTEKYSHVRPVELRDATTEILQDLCVQGGGSAVDAAYTLGRRLWSDPAEREGVASFLVDRLSDVEPQVREQMIVALKELAHPVSIEALVTIVEDPSETARSRAYALNALGMIGDLGTVDVVINYLRNLTNPFRDSASWSLQMFGHRARDADSGLFSRIKQVYLECLKAEQDDVAGRYSKGNIVYSLGSLDAREYVDEIMSWLQDENDPYVVEDSVQALGLLKDKRSAALLREYLHHTDPVVRVKAAEALGRLGDFDAAKQIEELLRDDYPIVRDAAAAVLELFHERRNAASPN